MNQRRSRKTKRGYKPLPPRPPRSKESPQPNVFFVALVALVGMTGVVSFIGLGVVLHSIRNYSEREALVRALPDVTRAAPGETAILDGRVAASEPARYKEFVAYIRERQRGGGGRSVSWIEVLGQATPPLAVDVGSRVYAIANGNYTFDRLLSNWTDEKRIDEGPTTWRNAVVIEGIAVNGTIMAVGQLLPKDGQLVFHAHRVVGISRAAYAQRLTDARAFAWKFAGILALIGPLGLYGGWRGVRRIMR